MEIGVDTFADVAGQPAAERLRNLVDEMEVADQVGLDGFGVGEHHRQDHGASARAVALAADAVRTRRIRLTSAVTLLSSDDPVRVFQQFATLDGLSKGWAEIMAGRRGRTSSPIRSSAITSTIMLTCLPKSSTFC